MKYARSIRRLLLSCICCAVVGVATPHGETGHRHGSGPPGGLLNASQTVTGPKFTKLQLSEHFWGEGAAFGDIDRDGRVDVVSGPYWYAGPDFKTKHEYYPATETFERRDASGKVERIAGFEGALGVANTYSDNFFVFVRDFNGDAWPDIMVFGFPGKQAAWYENPGKAASSWRRHVAYAPLDNESPTFVDLDGDGEEEIVANSQGYLGYAKRGTDPRQPWEFHRISTHEGWDTYTHGLGTGDINGDGRADVIEAQGWWEQPASLVGNPVWKRHRADFGDKAQGYGGAQFYAYDVNGDSLNDVVGSIDAHGYGLAWWEQKRVGERISFRRHLILQPTAKKDPQGVQFSQLHAVALADIDGDGLQDIVTGKRFWAHGSEEDPEPNAPAVLYWFKLQRDGESMQFIPKLIDADSGVGTQLTVADANGDNLPDIVAANKKGTFVHLQQFGGFTPKDAARALSLPPGFRASAFAGEPDVKQPIAFAIDDRGRLWVVEAYTYPVRRPEGQGTDRILVFDDTNGDGVFDRRTVFMSGLNLVSGIEIGFGGVWIGAAPHLLFIPIAPGDVPKPAGEPQILLDGWGYEDTHETLNTLNWGPDGWLYGLHGVFTNSIVGKPGASEAERVKINAGVWRYHPIKHRFEAFAHGTSNPWGMDFDSRGQMVAEACVIPHLWHFVQGGRYLRQGADDDYDVNGHFNPFTYDVIQTVADHLHYTGASPHQGNGISDSVGGGHAHAGLMIYQGGGWPQEYRGQAYMNNIHGARINVDALEPQGSGFVGRHRPDWIRFNDPWSQIVNLQYDQDGSVYLIDWYDQEQCHVSNPDTPDRGNGRIFKVRYGNKPATRIDMQRKSDQELVSDLLDQREWRVRHARRVLQERAAAGKLSPRVIQELRVGLGLEGQIPASAAVEGRYDSASDEAQLRFLWTLHAIGELTEADAIKLTNSRHPYVRAWAMQLAAEDSALSDAALTSITTLVSTDPSPVVRLYAASAALRTPPAKRWELVQALHARREDAGDHNLPIMNWYALEPLAALDHRRALAIALASTMPRTLEFTARRLVSLNDSDALAALTQALSEAHDPSRQLQLLSGMHKGLQGQRNVAMPEKWLEVEKTLSRSSDESVRSELLAVSLIFATPSSLATARRTLADKTVATPARMSALSALLNVRDPQVQPLLFSLLDEPPPLRAAAIRGLASFEDARTVARLLSLYPKLPASEKRDVLSTLASRVEYAQQLVAALSSGRIPASELPADIASQIRGLNNAPITAELEKSWGVAKAAGADTIAAQARYQAILEPLLPWTDSSRGRAVFQQTCGACHKLFGEGGSLGPDITGSNRTNVEYLLHNILNPNAEIPNNYRVATVTLKDGRVLAGFANTQSPQVVVVTTPNEVVRVPRSEIVTLEQSQVSMMPEGLLTPLSDDNVRDLISYLRGSEQVSLPSAGN